MGAQHGHGDLWQVCLAHQLREGKYAIEAADTIFAPQMKAPGIPTYCSSGILQTLSFTIEDEHDLSQITSVERRMVLKGEVRITGEEE